MSLSRLRIASILLAVGLAAASAPTALADDVRLATGEVLSGKVLVTSDRFIRFLHPVLGEINLPRDQVTILPTDPKSREAAIKAAAAAQPAPAAPVPAAPAVPPPPPEPPEPDSFWQGWKGSIDAGVNGSAGNTDTLSTRAGLGLVRKTEAMETNLNFLYVYSTNDGRADKSRAEINLRNDWFLKDSNWGFFALGKAEFDDFQSWLYRTSAFAGPSYAFIKNDTVLLRGRVGAGVSREFGRGADNAIIPEALLGVDFEYKFSDTMKAFATADYLPSLKRFTDFRVDSKAGLEFLLDKNSGLNLKLGVADRYKSNPSGVSKRNDIEYFATVGLTF